MMLNWANSAFDGHMFLGWSPDYLDYRAFSYLRAETGESIYAKNIYEEIITSAGQQGQ